MIHALAMEKFLSIFGTKFSIKDLGPVKHYLGMRVTYDKNTYYLDQEAYVESILKRFNMENCKPIDTPLAPDDSLLEPILESEEDADLNLYQQGVGSLMYLMTSTRPDLAVAVGLLSRFMVRPKQRHWQALKRVFRYLKKTANLKLMFAKFDETKTFTPSLVGYCDANYGTNKIDRKSTSGYLFQLNGCTITWNSRKQQIVALSTAEAEYISLTYGCQEALWIRNLLFELGIDVGTITLLEDNQGAIALSKNLKLDHRTKHIDIRYHFLTDHVAKGDIIIKYCRTEDMIADALTKGLPKVPYQEFRELMHLV